MANLLKVNLLPESARRTSLSAIEQFHRTPLMLIAAGAIVLLTVVLFIPVLALQHQLHQLDSAIEALEPRKMEVERLQRMLASLRTQESGFLSLKQGRGLWSKRLNLLSDATPEGVWFTELILDSAKGLTIEGAAIGQGEFNLGHLREELKANPEFASAVKDIQIESIKRVQEKEIEVVQFTLSCPLVTPGASATAQSGTPQ